MELWQRPLAPALWLGLNAYISGTFRRGGAAAACGTLQKVAARLALLSTIWPLECFWRTCTLWALLRLNCEIGQNGENEAAHLPRPQPAPWLLCSAVPAPP